MTTECASKSEDHSRPKSESRDVVYRIDAQDRIVHLSEGWFAFARETGSPGLTRQRLYEKVLWDFIADASTRAIYAAVLHQVRQTGRVVTFPFRCDGPEVRRFMEISISSLGEGTIEFRTRALRREPRERVALLDPSFPRSEDRLFMCAWCKRIPVAEEWLEVEAAIVKMDLFDAPALPRISHGICPACFDVQLGCI